MEWLKDSWFAHKERWLLGFLCLALVGLLAWRSWTGQRETDPRLPNSVKTASSRAKRSSSGKQRLCVDVKGRVNHPGVFYLAKGSRVQEAIAAAGGLAAGADVRQVNMAKEIQDEQLIYVPAPGESSPAGGTSTAVAESNLTGTMVNLNTASKEELMKIDGVGDKKADKILAYRQAHGQFRSAEDLKNVDGFGDKTVAKLRDKVAV